MFQCVFNGLEERWEYAGAHMSVSFWHTRRLTGLIVGNIYSRHKAPAPLRAAFRSFLLRAPGSKALSSLRHPTAESLVLQRLCGPVLASAVFRLRRLEIRNSKFDRDSRFSNFVFRISFLGQSQIANRQSSIIRIATPPSDRPSRLGERAPVWRSRPRTPVRWAR